MDLHLLDTVWRANVPSPPSTNDLTGVVRRIHSAAGSHAKQAVRKKAPPRQDPGDDFVEALAHGLAVLECWQGVDGWLTNAQLSGRSGLTRATVSRLTSVLVELGYLAREGSRGRFRLSAQTLDLGFANAFAKAPTSTVQPELSRLAEDLDVYVALSVRRRDRMQILENVVSPYHPNAVEMDVGGELPLCRSASGLAALSGLPESETQPLLRRLSVHYGDRWWPLARQLDRKRQEYQHKGYCTSVATLSRDVGAVAVPIAGRGSQDVFVLACGMSATEFYPERVERQIAPRLLESVRRISDAMQA